jgi:hypothetical protein
VEQRCVMAVLAENLFVVTLHWLIYRSGHRRASLPIISLSPTNRFNLVAKISRGAATLQMCHPPSMCCTYIFPCLSLTILPPPSATCITRPAIRSHARRSHWCCFYSLSAIRRVYRPSSDSDLHFSHQILVEPSHRQALEDRLL